MAKTIGLVLKRNAPEALESLSVVQRAAPDARLLVEATGYHSFDPLPEGVESIDAETFASESDLVLVLGGDGTLIHAARLLRNRVVPILGVNLGYVGFLTDVIRGELADILPRALAGDLPYIDRMRLDVRIERGGVTVSTDRVLNDAVINQLGVARIAQYEIRVGTQLVTLLRCDGVIVATPTGSTAYSMAAGGSILTPGIEAIAITPICPHALTQRPIVVGPDQEISVRLVSNSEAMVSFDGQSGQQMRCGDAMVVSTAVVPTRLVTSPNRDYFETLRAKLRWGES
jgi:NAD+ kinase